MPDFNTRSEMRRIAMQAPDKLIEKIEELKEQVRLLSAPMFEDLGGGYQKCSHPGMKKIFEIARKLQAERDEARHQLAVANDRLNEGVKAEQWYRDRLAVARETLERIAFAGTDCPPAMQLAEFYEGQFGRQRFYAREALAKIGGSVRPSLASREYEADDIAREAAHEGGSDD